MVKMNIFLTPRHEVPFISIEKKAGNGFYMCHTSRSDLSSVLCCCFGLSDYSLSTVFLVLSSSNT